MIEKINFHGLLFLCGILCQGIIGTLADGVVRAPSENLVREKRVVNLEPGGHVTTLIENIPYIVNIQENGRSRCAGAILSHHNVITAERCMLFDVSAYKVLSGAGYTHHGASHNVTSKLAYSGNDPNENFSGISLITVYPPFQYNRRTEFILLYTGPLHEGIQCSIHGWGCQYPGLPAHNLTRQLRSITLAIINQNQCANAYSIRFRISNQHVCTYDERKMCARGDVGTPLVVNNMLAGVHVYKGETASARNPDVYINLQRGGYVDWIWEHMRMV